MDTPIDPTKYLNTRELRWHRPAKGTDNEIVLEQKFVSISGEVQWLPIPVEFDD